MPFLPFCLISKYEKCHRLRQVGKGKIKEIYKKSTFGGLGPMTTELLQWIASEAYEKGLTVASSGAEHAIGQYRWGLIQHVGVATHTNSRMVQEARIRAAHPKGKTRAIYKAVLKRGYKSSKREAAARVYVYNAGGAPRRAAEWPKGAMHARASNGAYAKGARGSIPGS